MQKSALTWLTATLFVLCEITFAQPATVTLRAKLRDFRDHLASNPNAHPDFENSAFMDCGGSNLGYVNSTLGQDGLVDTSLFRDDQRNPVLARTNHPNNQARCYTSSERFNEWYNDLPEVNRSFYIDLALTRNAQGVYTYDNANFLPLNRGGGWQKFRPTDPDPFGPVPSVNDTDIWGFTMELHTLFTYQAGSGQVFSFSGDDDVWVFINGRLAIDLGGLHPHLSATVNLDQRAQALGLVDGGNYTLDFYFAERHSTGSHCQISTSLLLVQTERLPLPVATPSSQSFNPSLNVGLAVPGHADAQIRYTLDGREPNETSPLYSEAIALTATTTLKAKAFKADFLPSPTLTENYTRTYSVLPPPVANPPGGNFQNTLAVTLSATPVPGLVIRYTLDGSEPTVTSPVATGPIVLTTTTTLKAKTFAPDWQPSMTLIEVYTWFPPPNTVTLDLTRPIGHSGPLNWVSLLPDISRPISVISVESGTPRCLDCPPGAQETVLDGGLFPEWKTQSRAPFNYTFTIYDNLGNFVLTQSGAVTQAMLTQIPGDSSGFRTVSFRWLPVAHTGQAIGTGAYILQGKVVSEKDQTPFLNAGTSQSSLIKRFGYRRSQR